METKSPPHTNEVYVVSDTVALCICNPISYLELWIRRSRQTTPRGLVRCRSTLHFTFLHFTYPIVQLSDPRLSRVLDGWVQEDNLVLDPDLVYDWLDGHMSLEELNRQP